MHKTQITAADYEAAVARMIVWCRENGALAKGRGPAFRDWNVGCERWVTRHAYSASVPAVHHCTDLRDNSVTYWRDEPPALLPASESEPACGDAAPPPAKRAFAPGETFELQVDAYAGTWTREEWRGDERAAFEVTEVTEGTWRFVCHCYYGPRQRLELLITQPWDRACRTVVGLLRVDTLLEDSPVADPRVTAGA